MEIFRAPRVTLIARPQFLEPEHLTVQWRGDASDGERLAEYAGRICYMSQHNPVNRTTAEYLELVLSRAGASPRRLRVLAALPAVRGRVARGVRDAARDPRRRAARSGMGAGSLGRAGGLRPRGRGVAGAPRVGDRQGAPAQTGARGGAQRIAERHRGEDRRVGQRARVAHDARAAVRRGRRARDPAYGGRLSPRPAARGARPLLRLRDLRRRGQTGSRARHLPQSLTSDVRYRSTLVGISDF